MSIIGKWDIKGLDEFTKKLEKLKDEDLQRFNEDTVKEIAARTLAKIIAKTPVGIYEDKTVEFIAYKGDKEKEKEVKFEAKANKVGGTLRRGWTAGEDVDPYSFILNNSEVIKKGNTYMILISNIVDYASHVEYGHRTVNGTGWVDGRFMMSISEDEIQEELPGLLEDKLNKFLEGYFND